jgi:hypothetical protein
VGIPTEWRTLIHRATVAGVAITGRMPPGHGGPPAGGVPPVDRGLGGDLWGHHECRLCMYELGSPFLYRVVDTHFCAYRGGVIHWPTVDCICIFCKH